MDAELAARLRTREVRLRACRDAARDLGAEELPALLTAALAAHRQLVDAVAAGDRDTALELLDEARAVLTAAAAIVD